MKKYLLAIAGMMLAVVTLSAQAAKEQLTEGKQYTTLTKPVADQPEVLEFFSFYCPHCYEFEEIYHVSNVIKKNLPEGVKFTKYHAGFMGPLGEDLTKTWAVAMALGVEDKVLKPLFDGIQKTQTIKTTDDIRSVFVKAAGITDQEYDAAIKSFMVNALALKQKKAAMDLELAGVPAFYVKGKYLVSNGGMGVTDPNEYSKAFSQVVNQLLQKN
ncbi:MAG: thiol:disulfide interchange protein DsbA [Enterobacteriaceae bacterium]